MSKLLGRTAQATNLSVGAASDRTPADNSSLPERPSLDGYTIDELRTEQLAHLLKFEELRPEQVAH